MGSSFIKKISTFRALPLSVKKKVLSHYLHRITFTKSTNSEIIWTSFYYFALTQPVLINENKDDYLITFRYASRNLKLIVRNGESSDIYVFFQVFIRDEYAPLFNQLKFWGNAPNTCLDAGANVGYFSIAMLCWFGNCRIFSVEPDQENYNVLIKNISLNGFGSIVMPIHAALWIKNTKLFLKKRSVQEWSYSVTEEKTSDGECEALTISSLLHRWSVGSFYAVKIDVEGAEKPLFDDSDFVQCLQRSKIVALEIHDDKADRGKIQDTLCAMGFGISDHGELTLAIKAN